MSKKASGTFAFRTIVPAPQRVSQLYFFPLELSIRRKVTVTFLLAGQGFHYAYIAQGIAAESPQARRKAGALLLGRRSLETTPSRGTTPGGVKKCQARFLITHYKTLRYLVKRKNVPGTLLGFNAARSGIYTAAGGGKPVGR
ncbi:MAG: hypothetical protein LBK13_09060, partial [Spirochaetales bacterium]|nr:hypothetical protein [Spirochaetales bacterium]